MFKTEDFSEFFNNQCRYAGYIKNWKLDNVARFKKGKTLFPVILFVPQVFPNCSLLLFRYVVWFLSIYKLISLQVLLYYRYVSVYVTPLPNRLYINVMIYRKMPTIDLKISRECKSVYPARAVYIRFQE